MSRFKDTEIKKKIGKTVYLQEGVRKSLYFNDFLNTKKKEEKISKKITNVNFVV